MAGWTGKRVNVSFSKPEEPSFLKKFKERVGYKEDHGISDKFAAMPEATDEDLEDKDDELPQVVSLKSGDLSQEEYNRLRSEGKLDELLRGDEDKVECVVEGPKTRDEVLGDEPPADGRILFRKPTKRSSDDKEGQSSDKKQKGEEKSEKKDKKQKKKEQQKIKLLSFNEDEEEEED